MDEYVKLPKGRMVICIFRLRTEMGAVHPPRMMIELFDLYQQIKKGVNWPLNSEYDDGNSRAFAPALLSCSSRSHATVESDTRGPCGSGAWYALVLLFADEI